MQITTPIILCLFTAACGNHKPAPAPAPEPPHEVITSPTSPPGGDAGPPIDVHARCAELAKPSQIATAAARVLGTTANDVPAAVTCLADALDAARGLVIGGTEQVLERR